MASLPAPTARAVILVMLALLAACAPREVRPVHGAELAAAAADADGNLALVFDRLDEHGSMRLARPRRHAPNPEVAVAHKIDPVDSLYSHPSDLQGIWPWATTPI